MPVVRVQLRKVHQLGSWKWTSWVDVETWNLRLETVDDSERSDGWRYLNAKEAAVRLASALILSYQKNKDLSHNNFNGDHPSDWKKH